MTRLVILVITCLKVCCISFTRHYSVHHNQRQAGIRHEGQGKDRENSRAKANRERHKEAYGGMKRA